MEPTLGSGRFAARPTAFTVIVCAAVFFTAVANIGTSVYYLAVMPRLPQPPTGRIYRAGAAHNTAVYVNKSELTWLSFLHYDAMCVAGLSVVLLAIFEIIPKARREGRL